MTELLFLPWRHLTRIEQVAVGVSEASRRYSLGCSMMISSDADDRHVSVSTTRSSRYVTMAILAVVVATLLALGGCATQGAQFSGTEITAGNNVIRMPHYSFVVPADRGWRRDRPDVSPDTAAQFEVVLLSQREGSVLRTVHIVRNSILSASMQAAQAETVADDYRRRERDSMIELGVNKGLYELKVESMGREVIGGKTFYTMDSVTTHKQGNVVQRLGLFLYFPQPQNNRYFISAVFTEAQSLAGSDANDSPMPTVAASRKSEFISMMESLTMQ